MANINRSIEMEEFLIKIYESELFTRWNGIGIDGAKAENPKSTKRKCWDGLPAVKGQNAKKECRTFNGGPSGASRQQEPKQKEQRVEEEYLDERIETKVEMVKENIKRMQTERRRMKEKLRKMERVLRMKRAELELLNTEKKRLMELERLEKTSMQRKEESVEQLLKEKTVMEVTKILKDRVNRRIMMDRMDDQQNFMTWLINSGSYYCPALTELQNRTTKIKESEEDGKQSTMDASDEVKQRLEEEKRETQTPCPKLCGAFTRDFIRTTVTNGPTADEGQESWKTSGSEQKYSIQVVMLFEQELFVKNKKAVEFSDFEGLQEALLEAPPGEIPKYLQDIANKIRNACGVTETENVLQGTLILLCAAVHEMDHVGLELFNWDRLLTWGATYNKAKDAGFQVKFVEEHLKKILYAYLGYDFKREIDPKARIRNLEAELKAIEDCMSAQRRFEGNRLSHGLFSE